MAKRLATFHPWPSFLMESQTRYDLFGIISLIVFFAISALLFRSVDFAFIVVASLGFHELGHATAMARLGLRFHISFGLIGASTWSSSRQRYWLSPFQNAAIHLAGPLFSLLLALLALGLHEILHESGDHFLILANFSAQLGFFNLLPLGSLTDGGKTVQLVMGSLSRRQRVHTVFLPLLFTIFMLLLYWLEVFSRTGVQLSANFVFGLVLVAAWLAGSMLIEKQRIEEAVATPKPHPITVVQVFWLVLLLWGMLIFFLEIMVATPFWLAPEFVRGCYQNLLDLLTLIRPFVDRLIFIIYRPGF